MDRRAGACGASFLPSWPSFECLSSTFRTDSFVLPICDPLTGLLDGETRLRRKVQRGNPKSWSIQGSPMPNQGGNLSIWATNLQSLRRSRRRKNRQGRLQRRPGQTGATRSSSEGLPLCRGTNATASSARFHSTLGCGFAAED